MDDAKPYAGLRVLDLSQGLAGPHCGLLLAMHGADVVKVEPPEGDWARGIGRAHGNQTAISLANNRGKRGIVLNLKTEDGLAIAHKLAKRADIMLESFRPGVADRLHVGFERIRAINPRILYVSVSGFGQTGPYSPRPTTDTVVQAFSGLMSINRGTDGVPHRIGTTIVDTITGLNAFQAVAVALYRRGADAPARHLDISLAQSIAAATAYNIVDYHLFGPPVANLNPPAGSYAAADGWLAVTLVKEHQYQTLCRVLDLPELAGDPRFADFRTRAANLAALLPPIRARLAEHTVDHWLARFAEADVLANRVNDFGQWLADPHVAAAGWTEPVAQPGGGTLPFPRVPAAPAGLGASPDFGGHSREVLAELGYAPAAIDDLIGRGVVHNPESGP